MVGERGCHVALTLGLRLLPRRCRSNYVCPRVAVAEAVRVPPPPFGCASRHASLPRRLTAKRGLSTSRPLPWSDAVRMHEGVRAERAYGGLLRWT